jgi:RNA polymerase sigma-70 factor (ECF subfamily)
VKETDKIILDLLKAGDKAGLEQLFKLFYRPLVMYARQYIPNQDDAEDLVQEVFVRFWETKPYADITINLRSYLYQMVRNACLNHIKSNARYRFGSLDELPEISSGEMLDELEWNEYIHEIYQKIDLLPPRTREIFVAIVLENQKYKDVAGKMNISVNTVKTSLSRALATLRSGLSKGANSLLSLLLIL